MQAYKILDIDDRTDRLGHSICLAEREETLLAIRFQMAAREKCRLKFLLRQAQIVEARL